MKFELRKPQYVYENTVSDSGYFEIYVTRGEFMRCFEKDKKQAYHEFSSIADMYTSQYCFRKGVTEVCFNRLYDHFAEKRKFKGITLGITVDYDYSVNKLGREVFDLTIALQHAS